MILHIKYWSVDCARLVMTGDHRSMAFTPVVMLFLVHGEPIMVYLLFLLVSINGLGVSDENDNKNTLY